MTSPPGIEKALADLEEELGMLVRRSTRRPRTINPRTGRPRVRWASLFEWCKAHPGVGATLEDVYANAITNLRKRYPELTVEGSEHRRDEAGRRVATLYAIYEPDQAADA